MRIKADSVIPECSASAFALSSRDSSMRSHTLTNFFSMSGRFPLLLDRLDPKNIRFQKLKVLQPVLGNALRSPLGYSLRFNVAKTRNLNGSA